jgi:hypothetical protein
VCFEAKRHLDSNVPTSPADAAPDVAFVGRLATYRYYNMDQVVAQALSTHARMVKTERRAPALSEPRPTIALGAGVT